MEGQARGEEGGESENHPKERITIDRMAAKTLKLCVESTTTLLNEDIQAFVDFPLEQRIRIFTQMSQILNLSFELFGLFKRRPLKMYDFGGDSRSGTQFNIGLTFGVAQ